jgi:hypothetical protein
MVSRENVLAGVAVVLSVSLWFGLSRYTSAPDWALWLVLLTVGVVLPIVVRARR